MTATIDIKDCPYNFKTTRNPTAGNSIIENYLDYAKEAGNAYRVLRLTGQLCEAAALTLKQYGSDLASSFSASSKNLGIACAALSIPRLPSVTFSAFDAISDWTYRENSLGNDFFQPAHHYTTKLHDIFEAFATHLYVATFFSNNSAMKNLADKFTLGADSADLLAFSQEYLAAKQCRRFVNDPTVSTRLSAKMQESLIRIAKATASVVSGTLGLLMLTFNRFIVPGPVMLSLGLVSTISAMAAFFFKASQPYEEIRLFNAPQLTVDQKLAY